MKSKSKKPHLDAAAAGRVEDIIRVMRVGMDSRSESELSRDELIARDAMVRVIDLIEEALRGW